MSQQPGYTGFYIQGTGTFQADAPDKVEFSYPRIYEVRPESPAAKAGICVGDVVLAVNGKDARESGSLFPIVGEPYTARLRRGDAELEVTLVPVPKQRRG